ncbi:MBL fold metallo-hydrolase [Streptomyces sp. WAC06614]|uniref:MBL fold metallo-hydrolase n=1 Tax=Streptomyces sp. WAC06614 TaxID=2487416 RepID=UPI000F7A7DB9|nr:MBL fold metallo-hydrolase [Streptomyces sp. WAC06614]RSS78299.1 MBL fold metallo-hydrolase [Streptomyces sp. WAC06614]
MPVGITWWGHATCTVEDSGVRLLTDPLFASRLAHLRRRRGALPPPEAAVADAVLVSHLHADHLHLPSLATLAPGTRLVVPRGAPRAVPRLARLAGLRGLLLTEVAPGEEVEIGAGVSVRAVAARHDGRRLPFGPHLAPALGYVVQGAARTYFAGDTGLFDTMAQEVGPPAAAVPVHYGTYWPIGMDAVRPHEFHAPGGEFERLAARTAPKVTVRVPEHGACVRVP